MPALKQSILALAFAPALLAGPAAAATFAASTVGPDPYVNNVTKAAGSFLDVYNFSFAGGELLAGGTSLEVTFGPSSLFHIGGLTFSLFNGSTPIASFNPVSGSWLGNLAAGDYHFDVSGTASGLAGGNYTFTMTAVPVPEPGEWMMLTAGLVLLAGAARRRA